MPDRIPNNFQEATEGAIASYNYTDIAEGTGVVTFYLCHAGDNSSDYYFLTQNTPYAQDLTTSATLSGSSPTLQIDKDFDITFNLPKIIKGVAIINATIAITHNSGNGNCYAHIRIRKWDGTTETEIADSRGDTLLSITGTTSKTSCIRIPINDRVHFKKGETLRVTFQVWGEQSAGSGTVYMAHDPAGRDTLSINTNGTTASKAFIPFVLDL